MSIEIPRVVADRITAIDDDIVALVSSDLREQGLFHGAQYDLWNAHMAPLALYEDHWLIAYEAHEQGWLTAVDASDYVADDEFFSILQSNKVRFYGTELSPAENEFKYWDDDEAEDIPETEDDDVE